MKMLTLIILICCFTSCGSENEHQLDEDSLYFQLEEVDHEELVKKYDALKNHISSKQKSFSGASDEGVRSYLLATLTDSVFHFWYDTEWDFNGVTQEPRKGNIACGYFVTTTLLHCGFNLPRAKLAQQAASIIIKTLCSKKSIKTFSDGNLKGLKSHLKKSIDGLYIIGLDNHVGFIHKKDTSLVMIHADAVNGKVCRERLDDCSPIVNSQFHMIGNLLENEAILDKWRGREKITMTE